MTKREVPINQRCFFCADRWAIAIGGQRLCHRHAQLVEEIAADAAVPLHITVHRLTREPARAGPETVGDLMPAAVAEILANQKLPPRSTPAVPAPLSRER